jgi:hypothetical protein
MKEELGSGLVERNRDEQNEMDIDGQSRGMTLVRNDEIRGACFG